MKKTQDGDELDLDAIVDTRADIRTGASPDERVYSRRERLRRDVGAALLVDLSASTDDIIPEEREPPMAVSHVQDIRDPYFDEDDDYDFQARMAEEAAKRRIIDIQRESVLLLGTALESLGDRYGIYGFSGYGRDCVEFYVAKAFDDPLDDRALDAVAAMKPKRSTRMGPAIRHACAKLDVKRCGAQGADESSATDSPRTTTTGRTGASTNTAFRTLPARSSKPNPGGSRRSASRSTGRGTTTCAACAPPNGTSSSRKRPNCRSPFRRRTGS